MYVCMYIRAYIVFISGMRKASNLSQRRQVVLPRGYEAIVRGSGEVRHANEPLRKFTIVCINQVSGCAKLDRKTAELSLIRRESQGRTWFVGN